MVLEKKIYCIIPAFNEEATIAKVISSVKPYVYKIVVIDDGSNDETFSLVINSGATVLRHIINRGQGAALQTGNEYSVNDGADIIVHFDADGQFLASEITDVTAPIIKGEYDVILGSRFLEKKSKLPWFKEKIIIPIARSVNRILLGVKLSDPQSGFRAFSSNAAAAIKIQNDGSAHCSELLHKITSSKFRVKEVPITVIYNDFGTNIFVGKGRGAGGLKIIRDLILAKFIK